MQRVLETPSSYSQQALLRDRISIGELVLEAGCSTFHRELIQQSREEKKEAIGQVGN